MHILYDQTAKDLVGAEALDSAIIRETSECIALLDADGCIVDYSDWTFDLLGSPSTDTLKGNTFWSVWPEDAQTALKRAVSRGLDGSITQYWSRFEHADGSVTYWDIRLSPLHDARDQVGGVLAVSRKLASP